MLRRLLCSATKLWCILCPASSISTSPFGLRIRSVPGERFAAVLGLAADAVGAAGHQQQLQGTSGFAAGAADTCNGICSAADMPGSARPEHLWLWLVLCAGIAFCTIVHTAGGASPVTLCQPASVQVLQYSLYELVVVLQVLCQACGPLGPRPTLVASTPLSNGKSPAVCPRWLARGSGPWMVAAWWP